MWVYLSSPDLHFLVCKMGSGGTVYTIEQNGMLHLASLAQSSFGPWADSCPVQREQMAGWRPPAPWNCDHIPSHPLRVLGKVTLEQHLGGSRFAACPWS